MCKGVKPFFVAALREALFSTRMAATCSSEGSRIMKAILRVYVSKILTADLSLDYQNKKIAFHTPYLDTFHRK